MCTAAIAIPLIGSVLGAGASYLGQQQQVQAQNKSNQQWMDYQRQASLRNQQADDAARQQAETARQAGLAQITPAAAATAQQDTANRQIAGMTPNNPALNPNADPNTTMLSGQSNDQNTSVSSDMARIVSGSIAAARPRIQALANINGFTGGYGSANDTANRALQASGQGIDFANDLRKGNDMTLAISQNVPARTYTQGQDIGGGVASALGNLAGNAFAQSSANPFGAKTAAGSFQKGW